MSIGFMTNFLSLKEMFLISLQGKPIFGVILVNVKEKLCSSWFWFCLSVCIYANSDYTTNMLLLLGNHLLIILFIDIEPQSVHSQPQLGSFLVLDVEIVDSVHLQILSNLQILHHGFLPVWRNEPSLRD